MFVCIYYKSDAAYMVARCVVFEESGLGPKIIPFDIFNDDLVPVFGSKSALLNGGSVFYSKQ
jgi:hypothetical protein